MTRTAPHRPEESTVAVQATAQRKSPPRRRGPVLTPTRAAVILAVLLVVGCGVVGGVSATRSAGAGAAGLPTRASSKPIDARPVVVIGDDPIAAPTPTPADARWTSIVADRLRVSVPLLAARGTGYAVGSTADDRLAGLAARIPRNTRAVVFFGGGNDTGADRLALLKGATRAFAAARSAAPSATLVVIGPVSAGTPPARLLLVRDALSSAAAIAHARFVDPIQAGWLSGSSQSTAASGSLSGHDEQVLAGRMVTLLKPVLARR